MDYFRPLIYKKGKKWVINNKKLRDVFSKYKINTQEEMTNYLLNEVANNQEFVFDFVEKLRKDSNHIEKFLFHDKNNELIFLVINSLDLERKIMTIDYEWKSYVLNKFKKYKSDEHVEENRRKLYKVLFEFEKNSKRVRQQNFSSDNVDINSLQLDNEFEQRILKEIPDNFSSLQKAYFIYKRLCQEFSYDEESFIFNDNNSLTTIDHSNKGRIAKLNGNEDVVCYEFSVVFSKFLENLGISYKLVDYYGTEVGGYGDGHMQVKFMVDDYVVDADAATGIYGSDMSLEKSFGITKNFKLDDDYSSATDKMNFVRELDIVDNYLNTCPLSNDFLMVRDIYYNMDISNNDMSRDEKINLLIDNILKNDMKFIDIFQWSLYLSKNILEDDLLSSYRLEFIINNNPVQDKKVELVLLVIYNSDSSIFDNSNNNKYIVITPDRKITEYNYSSLKKKFRCGEFQMIKDRFLDNFEENNIDNIGISKKIFAKKRMINK